MKGNKVLGGREVNHTLDWGAVSGLPQGMGRQPCMVGAGTREGNPLQCPTPCPQKRVWSVPISLI